MDANDERNMELGREEKICMNISTYMKNKSFRLWKASLFIWKILLPEKKLKSKYIY
jgi:hypothetical protein